MGSAASAFGLFDIGIALKVAAKVSSDVGHYACCFCRHAQLLHVVYCQTDTTGQYRKHSLVDRRHMSPFTLSFRHATTCDVVHNSPFAVDQHALGCPFHQVVDRTKTARRW